MILTQTWAMLVDAYRELHARRLFWISMAISILVVVAFAIVGINDRGVTVLWYTIEVPQLTTKTIPAETFYRFVYANVAIPFWLTWGAMILALISTASIVPDFVAGGSIELWLSKPIGRLRLLATKYATALLCAGLQVLVFSVAAFLVIGIRGGSWDLTLFLAVPIVLLFFSCVYCVCALVGFLTRSTIAALLIALVFWFTVFGVGTTERVLLSLKIVNELRQERLAGFVESIKAQQARQEEAAAAQGRELDASISAANAARIASRETQLTESQSNGRRLVTAHAITFGVKSVLPKTGEIVGLLDRWLLTPEERARFRGNQNEEIAMGGPGDDVRINPNRLEARLDEEFRSRSLAWVIGTSLAFQGAVLGFMAWRFARRDF